LITLNQQSSYRLNDHTAFLEGIVIKHLTVETLMLDQWFL